MLEKTESLVVPREPPSRKQSRQPGRDPLAAGAIISPIFASLKLPVLALRRCKCV